MKSPLKTPSKTVVPLPILPPPGREISWAKWLTLTLMGYWAVFAVVSPVTNWDSQSYNLSRLYMIQAHGLFTNKGWSSARQIFFPWSFDAIHYPFIFLGWGYCLPSYACFAGVLIVVYRLVAAVRPANQAWWCCLALLAMPTLIFQSICTKNDVAVVFAIACWFYAWILWQAERRERYLVYMALALCFGAGAKTFGLPYLGILGFFTLWQLRTQFRAAFRFCVAGTVFFLLLGSVEIYLNNQWLFHSALGPHGIIDTNVNRDGLPGATANFIRWFFDNMNVGIDAANPDSPFPTWMENACRAFLRFVGLHNVGYRYGTGDTDENMHMFKIGYDGASDYGPVGAMAIIASLGFVFARPRTDPVWKLAAAGLATLVLTSYTVGWLVYDNRFLVLPFTLLTLALSLWIFQLGSSGRDRFARSFFMFLIVYSTIMYPLYSYTKKPSDLLLALRHRPVYETKERPTMLEIVRDLRRRTPRLGEGKVLLVSSEDSWCLCVFEVLGRQVELVSEVDLPTLRANVKQNETGIVQPVYVLALNWPLRPEVASTVTLVQQYTETNSGLYRWQPTAPATP